MLPYIITTGYAIHLHIIILIYNVLVEPKWSWLDVLFNGGTSSEVVASVSVWLHLSLECKLVAADLTLHKILGVSFLKNLIVKTMAQIQT